MTTGPLTAAGDRRRPSSPYRAASLLPGRAYHDAAIHELERREWFRARLDGRRPRGGRAPAGHVLPGHRRRRATADRRPRPRRRSCAPSTTSAATAARRSWRSRAARSSGSSARTTRGSTTWKAPGPGEAHRRPRGLRHRGLRPRVGPDRDLAGFRVRVPRPDDGRRSSSGSATCRAHSRGSTSRACASAKRVEYDGRRELEVHRRELQRVLPLPGHPPAAQQADAVRPRRRLRPRPGLAGRLDGARRRAPRRWRSTAARARATAGRRCPG